MATRHRLAGNVRVRVACINWGGLADVPRAMSYLDIDGEAASTEYHPTWQAGLARAQAFADLVHEARTHHLEPTA